MFSSDKKITTITYLMDEEEWQEYSSSKEECNSLFTISVNVPSGHGIDDNYVVDIKNVCDDGKQYIDAVLFRQDENTENLVHEVMALEPSYDDILGEYIFELDEAIIVVNVDRA